MDSISSLNKRQIKTTYNKLKTVLVEIVFIAISIFLCCFICGCNSTNNFQPVKKTTLAFDTVVSITIYDCNSENNNDKNSTKTAYSDYLIDECFNLCSYYENLFSRTVPTSEISQINSSNGKPVNVSQETMELIEKGIYYGDISDGLFDITIASVSNLWDFHNDNTISQTYSDQKINSKNAVTAVPDNNDIRKAVKHVSYKYIIIDKASNTVSLSDKEAMIDLGGIAKGYIADKLKEYLVNKGVSSALIDLGGNIVVIGAKPDGSPFKIGIKKPFSENEIETSVELTDKAVSTSGVYERFFLLNDSENTEYTDSIYIDGKKLYHHILNPKTGYPVNTDIYGASVICDKSIDADALSTIYILKGYKEGKAFFDSLKDVEAICSPAE